MRPDGMDFKPPYLRAFLLSPGGRISEMVSSTTQDLKIDVEVSREAMARLSLENQTSLRRIYREVEELEFIEERIADDRT
jgi:hypothetical protein